MLTQLRLQHFAILTDCHLEFGPGFTVLTGETGAGKSIIVDAIGLLLGEQASEDWIQSGQDSAIIEGIFHMPSPSEALAPFVEDEGQLIIYRRLSRTKPNTIRINNQSVTLKTLKQLGHELANIIGQHEHMTLLDPEAQRQLLDHYIGTELVNVLNTYTSAYQQFKDLEAAKQHVDKNRDDAEQRLDFLQFQLQDMQQHQLQPGEDEVLEAQKKDLKHLDKLRHSLNDAYSALSQASTHLHTAKEAFSTLQDIDQDFATLTHALDDSLIHHRDYMDQSQHKMKQIEHLNPDHLDHIESRLDVIFRLKQKYKVNTVDALLEKQATIETDIQHLRTLLSDGDEQHTAYDQAHADALALAKKIHKHRAKAAPELAQHIQRQLAQLHLEQSQVQIEVHANAEQLGPFGHDSISVYLSTNPGEAPKPIHKIASGGELSRIMLAIKALFYDHAPVPTLIYDEVDTGIGGLTALKIGEFLKQSAAKAQVLCVTHLPQLAKFADHHLLVIKHTEPDATVTHIRLLDDHEIPTELERMVGGKAIKSLLN